MTSLLTAVFVRILDIGIDPNDQPEDRLQKHMFVAALFVVLPATIAWGTTYSVFHEPVVGALSYLYCLFTLVSLIVIRRTCKVRVFMFSQIFMGLVVAWLIHILLGGFAASGGVLLWALMGPIAASFFFEFRQALPWWLAYLGLLIAAGILDPFLNHTNHLPPDLVTVFFVMNIGAVTTIVLGLIYYFGREKNLAYKLLSLEEEKSEQLLLNILPKEIAAILKNENRTIADNFAEASILFADLVGFTPLTAQMAPVEMVSLLNHIFSHFDSLVEKYGLEKIRTIGDNYMVAAGVPRRRSDHALALAKLALEMRDFVSSLPPVEGKQIQFRIGINSGAVVGGVIGRKKFVYDLWGDAVNIASRMESHGMAGAIQITHSTYEQVYTECLCEPRGVVEVKGKGPMQTWFLIGLKSTTQAPRDASAEPRLVPGAQEPG
jgi:adenylate cyclase